MSIFIKAGLWIEKQVGYKGELNLTRLVTDLIASNPSSPAIIETDGVFNSNLLFTTEQIGIPQQGATGLVTISNVEARSYNISSLNFSNPNDITFIKFNDSIVNYLSLTVNTTSDYAVIFNNLTYIGQEFQISGNVSSISLPILENANVLSLTTAAATSINLPSLVTVINLTIVGDSLTSINVPILTSITGSCSLYNTPLLTSVIFPSLTYVTSFSITSLSVLTSVTFPLLNGDILIETTLSISQCPLLTYINLPSLTSFYNLTLNNNTSLISINLDTLVNVNSLILNNNALTFISLPALTYINYLNLNDNALTEASVDYVLAKLVSIPTFTGADREVALSGGINSPPSAAGLLNVAILEARGCSVSVNV